MEAAVDREWVESVATDLVDDGRAGIECNEVEPVEELDTESSSGIGVFLISFPSKKFVGTIRNIEVKLAKAVADGTSFSSKKLMLFSDIR